MYYVPFLYEYANEKLAYMLASICLIGGVKKDPDTLINECTTSMSNVQ